MGWCADLPGKLCYEKLDKKIRKWLYDLCQKIWSKRGGPTPPPPPPHPTPPKKNQIWILCQNSLTREFKIRVVGFVLKKLLTYIEMLIVPHALQCVDGWFFVFYRIWHLLLAYWIQNKIVWQNSLTRKLKIRVVGFVLKKILTYFEMLIVPHALHCVDSCIFVFTSFDTVWHTVLVLVPPLPLFPPIFFYQI